MNKQKDYHISTKLSPFKKTVVYDTYWKFAYRRQEIFFDKISCRDNSIQDPILDEYKFTNAYRASDRVSQYLIKEVIYGNKYSVRDTFLRIILFKIFNKIETWQMIEAEVGQIDLSSFDVERFSKILDRAFSKGISIYSGAYIMASGKNYFGNPRKHKNHLELIQKMLDDNLPEKISNSKNMQEAFILLRDYPTLGDFLAYQYVTDINYSTIVEFSEEEFVVPGPGAKDGIKKCFEDLGGLNESEVIKLMMDVQSEEFERLGLKFRNLWGRDLKLIDCQNLFCEVDKYSRVAHPNITGKSNRTRIKQKYAPKEEPIVFWYPPSWGLNQKIEKTYEQLSK